MDFVVAGFGVGAILMLLGFAVRDLGPLRYRAVQQLTPVHDEWLAMCRSVGTVLVVGGLIVCLATLVSLLAGAGDKTGSRSVMAIVAIAVIGCGVWSVLAIRRFVALRPGQEITFGRYEAFPIAPPSLPYRRSRRGVNRQPAVETFIDEEFVEDAVDFEVPVADVEDAEQASAVDAQSPDVPPTDVIEVEPIRPSVQESPPTQQPALARQEPTTVEPTEPTPDPDQVGQTKPEPRFASRLLADVEDAKDEPVEGFRSTLFAGLDDHRAAPSESGFSSSILADLGKAPNGSTKHEDERSASAKSDVGDEPPDTTPTADVTPSTELDEAGEVAASRRSSASGTEF